MDVEGILAIIFVLGGGTCFALSLSPVGRALADRIRSKGAPPAVDSELLAEVDALRQELSELQERVDFTERLLARQQERAQVTKGGTGE
jgi:hypothetical protein